MTMQNQNPYYNVTLKVARRYRDLLNRLGFPVAAIYCNPSPVSQPTISLVPEVNIPRDGDAYNLEFSFQDVWRCVPVRQVIDILQSPGLPAVELLHRTLWPNASRVELAGRLFAMPEITKAVGETITGLATEVLEPEGTE